MFIVSQQRKKYTPEYRREAANLVIESQRPTAHVAKEIGVAPGLFRPVVKNERERRGASDGMSEDDLFVLRMLAYAVSWLKPRWIMSFWQKRQPSSPQSNTNRKVRINAASEGELQHQTYGTAIKSVSILV